MVRAAAAPAKAPDAKQWADSAALLAEAGLPQYAVAFERECLEPAQLVELLRLQARRPTPTARRPRASTNPFLVARPRTRHGLEACSAAQRTTRTPIRVATASGSSASSQSSRASRSAQRRAGRVARLRAARQAEKGSAALAVPASLP